MVTKEEKKRNKFPIFQKRFNELRGEMSQDDFAKFVGISRPTVGFYENGERVPDAIVLNRIADACDVDVDYLLGRTDVRRGSADDRVLQKRFGLSDCSIKELDNLATGKDKKELFFLEHNPELINVMKMKFPEEKDYIGFLNLLFENDFSEIIRSLYDAYTNYKTDKREDEEYYALRDEFDSHMRKELLKSRLTSISRLYINKLEKVEQEPDIDINDPSAIQPMRVAYFDAEGSLEFMLNMVKKNLEAMIRNMEEEGIERGNKV